MPIAAAAGWLFGRMWRWHLVGRARHDHRRADRSRSADAGTGAAGALSDDGRSTTCRARTHRSAARRGRRGPFDSVPVSTKAAWYRAADLDGQPGDELAIVDHSGADIFDSATLDAQDPHSLRRRTGTTVGLVLHACPLSRIGVWSWRRPAAGFHARGSRI